MWGGGGGGGGVSSKPSTTHRNQTTYSFDEAFAFVDWHLWEPSMRDDLQQRQREHRSALNQSQAFLPWPETLACESSALEGPLLVALRSLALVGAFLPSLPESRGRARGACPAFPFEYRERAYGGNIGGHPDMSESRGERQDQRRQGLQLTSSSVVPQR